jgi:hypothetical protein
VDQVNKELVREGNEKIAGPAQKKGGFFRKSLFSLVLLS